MLVEVMLNQVGEQMQRSKLSYGISDFKSLRNQGYLYIDKTAYIETLESYSAKYLFFIRPRRFGKSLFLSMLEHYYGVEHHDQFASLFGEFYIGQHPTELRNSYLVLKLNFSGLNTDDKSQLEQTFLRAFKGDLNRFFNKYTTLFSDNSHFKTQVEQYPDFRSLWDIVFEAARQADRKIYLIIDEYDHFANDIIAESMLTMPVSDGNSQDDGQFYKNIIRATGFVRDFYETIKLGTEYGIDRIFMTGVSPIMLDDLTSGFNISTNITMNAALNEMLGFTENEVRTLMGHGMTAIQEITLEELRKNYNGYLFHEDGRSRMYNPDMILYFFTQWGMSGKYPKQLMDENVKTDYGRLHRLMGNEKNRQTLDNIIRNEEIAADIVNKFSFELMYDEQYFVSLLFYMGLLTIDRQEKMWLVLKVPNYVIQTIFWEFIERRLRLEDGIQLNTEELRNTIRQMAYEGRIKPYIEYIGNHVIKQLSNRDLIQFDEKYLKVILFAYLIGSRAYRPISERETENGYMDIFLEKDPRIPDIQYEWIIELKYLKKSETAELEKTKIEGMRQLKRYAESREIAEQSNVKQALVIFIGKDAVVILE